MLENAIYYTIPLLYIYSDFKKDQLLILQICNNNRYIQVTPDDMKVAHHIMKNPDLLDSIAHPEESPIDYESLTLKETGVPLKLGLLHDSAWKRKIDVFYCCAICGKIFWVGPHFAKVREQFAYLLDSN